MIGKHAVRIQLVEADDAASGAADRAKGAATGLPAAATNGSMVKDVQAGTNEIDIRL